MKVLLTAIHTIGGIRTFLRYTYGHPAFADSSLHIVTPDETLAEYVAEIMPEGRMTVLPTPGGHRALAGRIRREMGSGDYDLVHSHGFTAGVLTSFAGFGTRMPHIMTGHDLFSDGPFAGFKGRLRKLGADLAYSRLDLIHAVTDAAAANFVQYFPRLKREKIETIMHGIDTDYFAGGEAVDHRAEFGIAPEIPLIGFFGRFMAPKGFRDLVGAMALIVGERRMDPLPKVVAFGWGGFVREDMAHVEDLGLSEHFVLAPHSDDMPGALRGVDVVAMPSRWEACGLLAMETLSAGVPIVGTSCSGLKEVLSGSPARVVEPRDQAALATALVGALQDDDRAFRDYQATACERFGATRAATGIRRLYDRLV